MDSERKLKERLGLALYLPTEHPLVELFVVNDDYSESL
jgi:hypothetical protein